MNKLLITCPNHPAVRKEMDDLQLAELLVNTFGSDENGVIMAMQAQRILFAGNVAIVGKTVWSLE